MEEEECTICNGVGYIILRAGDDGWPDTTEPCSNPDCCHGKVKSSIGSLAKRERA
jgi:hypothetical protein